MSTTRSEPGAPDSAGFAATRWTVVLAAADQRDAPAAADALAELCRTYWYPLYAFIRRRGYESHAAEDLTQEFFARLLDKRLLAGADREKGKFRAFLLAAVKNFLANEWDRSRAQKRGGGRAVVAWDALSAEARYQLEPAHELTPERLFERRWALGLLDQVLARLQDEFDEGGKARLFDALKGTLAGGMIETYAAIADRLGISEVAVKVAVHRLRRRYRELLRAEIAHTVADPAEIDEEIRHLLNCL